MTPRDHPIFDDIDCFRIEKAMQRVLVDPGVLEERNWLKYTPLMYAIMQGKSDIAVWIIQHRGQHDLDTRGDGKTLLTSRVPTVICCS